MVSPSLHRCALGDETVDVGELLQPDLALDEQVGAADVEIIAAAAGQVLELPAGVVLAEIELEADALQPCEQVLVELPGFVAGQRVALARQLERHRGRDQVVILQRALVVGRVDQLRRRLDADHQRRGALHHRHLGAAGMQVLRDVVAAVAGADHDAPSCPSIPRRRCTGWNASPCRQNSSGRGYRAGSECR